MQCKTMTFCQPPIVTKDDGSPRRVGFELEFSGIDLEQAADTVQSSLDAVPGKSTAAERIMHVDGLGDFVIEVDWEFLKRTANDQANAESDAGWLDKLSQAAALVVPIEIACPPVLISELHRLEPMVAALRDAGAQGTEESLVAAYGLHINVELPRVDAATVYAYVTAFCLLQWWLVDAHEIDATRRISNYIALYPEAYVVQTLSRSEPGMDEIFADYLQHNPSRNRALDLLPLLAEIDIERVRRAVEDPRIKPRPALHYRLPDCHIEREGWSPAGAWNVWQVVERLAKRPDDRAEMCAAFLDTARPVLGVNRREWVKFVDGWLKARELA
jgi:hypothetical protein